jgi:hypothetical protein
MSEQCIPQDKIPIMPSLTSLLPLDILLIYLGCSLSNFTIDKDNKTITMSEPYTYDSDVISNWKNQIQQYEETYLTTLTTENPDYEIVENDRVIFVEIYKWIDMIERITKQ